VRTILSLLTWSHESFRHTRCRPVVCTSSLGLTMIHMHPFISSLGILTSQLFFLRFDKDILILHYLSPGVFRWAYKKARELARQMASYRGKFQPGHPRFPIGSQTAINLSTAPVDVSSPNIAYSSEDNKAIFSIEKWVCIPESLPGVPR
jgi:hypothetical protein